MEQPPQEPEPHDVYSLRDRIEDQKTHAPSQCTARPDRATRRATTVCEFGERTESKPRALTGHGRLVT